MLRFVRSSHAEADLIEIWSYIADVNFTAADEVADRFEQVFQKLSVHPELGRKAPELGVGYRVFVAGSYLIFYRAIGSDIEIARVLHGAREITAEFFRD